MCICCDCRPYKSIYACIPYKMEEKEPFFDGGIEYRIHICYERNGSIHKEKIYFNTTVNDDWKNIHEKIKNITKNFSYRDYEDPIDFFEKYKNDYLMKIQCYDRSWTGNCCYFIDEIIDDKTNDKPNNPEMQK